jgi:hypothetical protein
MDAALLLLLGLEVDRFAGQDDAADALTASLEALESGGWSLSPYQGPAIQPYLGLRGARWQAQLAPAVAFREGQAESVDGRSQSVRTVQAALEASAQWTPGLGFAGLDLGVSGGRARLDGQTIATGAPTLRLGPTAGLRVALHDHVDLVGRARYLVEVGGDGVAHGLGGALAVELHR